MSLKAKAVVRLIPDQRDALRRIVHTGSHAAAMRRRAHILLKTDADGPDAWPDERIAEALGTTRHTVQRVRQQFVSQGLDATLHRKKPTGRQYRKLDGEQEAKLIAIACSPPPQGRARWTMKRMADRLVELEVVESIDPATPPEACAGRLKKRDQAVAQAAVGDPAQGQRRVRRGDGRCAGHL